MGCVTCSECRERMLVDGARYRQEHAQDILDKRKAEYAWRKEHGLCVKCGREIEEDEGTRCGGCSEPSPKWAIHNQDPVMLLHVFANRG